MNKFIFARNLFVPFLAFGFIVALAACGSGGGGSGSSSTTTTTTSVTQTDVSTTVQDLSNTAGGGTGQTGSATTALTVAEKVSVVESGSSATVNGIDISAPLFNAYNAIKESGVLNASATAAANDTTLRAVNGGDNDYVNDPQDIFIAERSTEAFNTVNDILCIMTNTKYDLMLNQGDYVAQINSKTCDTSGRDSASGKGSDSTDSSRAASFDYWTVNSYRATETSKQIVSVWGHMEMETGHSSSKQNVVVLGRTVISEGTSATNPYGIFTFSFKIFLEDSTTGKADTSGGLESCLIKGFLAAVADASNQVVLKFGNKQCSGAPTGFAFSELATLYRSPDGTTGGGTVEMEEPFGPHGAETKAFVFAFNDSFFARAKVDTSVTPNVADTATKVCLDRNNLKESIWRYNLYDSAATRVAVNSGYPVKYIDNSSVEHYGWMGYWGLWMEGVSSLTSGSVVYKSTWSDGTETPVAKTVFVSNGKLTKHTNATMSLKNMHGIPFEWGTFDTSTSQWVNFQLEWNATTQKLMKIAQMDQTNWTWDTLATPVEVVISDFGGQWDLWFWSQALGGGGRIALVDPTTGNSVYPTNSTQVKYQTEDIVYPGDTSVPTTLMCFENCPNSSAINTTSPYYASTNWETGGTTLSEKVGWNPGYPVATIAAGTGNGTYYYKYSYNRSSMVLTDSTAGGAIEQTTAPTGDQGYGVWTGQLIDPANFTSANFACDWNSNATCTWKLYEISGGSYYTYQTGPNEWNRFTALYTDTNANGVPDAGETFDTFSPPLQVTYAKPELDSNGDPVLNADSEAITKNFLLEYGGYGDLWGIPGKCIDEGGADTDCYDSTGESFIRWVPEFSIEDGSEVTNSGNTYYVRSLEKERRMLTTPTCDIAMPVYDLPVPTDFFVDPANPATSVYIGLEPDMGDAAGEAPISVIDGAVQ